MSLVPSSTETLLAVGADVVACTKFCEQPTLLAVGGTKNPDVGTIIGLLPDLVVMDRQENRRRDAEVLSEAGLRLHVSDVCSVEDAYSVVRRLAELVDLPDPEMPPPPSAPQQDGARRVFVPIWRRPWMSIARETYGASILSYLGCRVVGGSSGEPYPAVDLDEVAAADPELVIIPSEPYEFSDGHIAELRSALPGAEFRRVDGRDLFWWGIRTPAALGRMGSAVLPSTP